MADSEVAQDKQRIQIEYESAQQGLTGLGVVANHRSINARVERAVQRIQRLVQAGKEQEARELLCSDALYDGEREKGNDDGEKQGYDAH